MDPNTRLSGLTAILTLLAPLVLAAADQTVVWTNVVNATVTEEILQKTGGCDGCDDAGATSQQELTTGDGYVDFTVGETNTFWLAGLSHGNDGTSFGDIDFALRFNGAGSADVWEGGVYQSGGDTTYAVGDIFRVAVVRGASSTARTACVFAKAIRSPNILCYST